MSFVSIYIEKFAEDAIPGGMAEGNPDSKYPKDQLRMGMKVEKEHFEQKGKPLTKADRLRTKDVAKDHLEEDKKYYTKLKKMEEKSATIYVLRGFEKRAMDKEGKLFGNFLRAAGGAVAKGTRAAAKGAARGVGVVGGVARRTTPVVASAVKRFVQGRVAPAIQRAAPVVQREANRFSGFVGQNFPATGRVMNKGVSAVSKFTQGAAQRAAPVMSNAAQRVQRAVSPVVQRAERNLGRSVRSQAQAGGLANELQTGYRQGARFSKKVVNPAGTRLSKYIANKADRAGQFVQKNITPTVAKGYQGATKAIGEAVPKLKAKTSKLFSGSAAKTKAVPPKSQKNAPKGETPARKGAEPRSQSQKTAPKGENTVPTGGEQTLGGKAKSKVSEWAKNLKEKAPVLKEKIRKKVNPTKFEEKITQPLKKTIDDLNPLKKETKTGRVIKGFKKKWAKRKKTKLEKAKTEEKITKKVEKNQKKKDKKQQKDEKKQSKEEKGNMSELWNSLSPKQKALAGAGAGVAGGALLTGGGGGGGSSEPRQRY